MPTRRVVALFHAITTVLVGLYTLGMLFLALAWAIAPERTWWIALANILAPHLFLPLLVVVPLALVFRSRAIGSMAALLLAVFLLQSGPRLLPRIVPQATDQAQPAGRLRVVTFNQLFSNRDLPGSLAVLKEQQADIIALQELSTPMVEAIAGDGELLARYPYRWLLPAERTSGMGLLSRQPFDQLPASDDVLMQAVGIEVAGQRVTLINAHPIAPALSIDRLASVAWLHDVPLLRRLPTVSAYNPRRRNEHLQALLDDIDGREGPLVLLGDLNTADRDPAYHLLAARLRDVYGEVGWGFGNTFPNSRFQGRLPVPFALVRIDYIWTRGGLAPRAARVVCAAAGSDHCMLVADLEAVW